jgi:transposase InsO family protein
MQRGYSRSLTGLYRFLKKQGIMAVHPPNPKYIPKPYEQMDHPGQRIQVDMKFVPSACLVNSKVIGKHFFQYTAIDEYSRWRFVEAFEEHSTYSSAMFVEHLIKAFPCPIECLQTDNGTEFTNRFTTHRDKPTLFQVHLEQHGIQHKVIRPYTPRHNGKVERSHRKDNERFYATHSFYSFEDFARQLKVYNHRDYNSFPMRPLGWKTPNQVLRDYFQSV